MANNSNYQPLDKLILFDTDTPRVGWIVAPPWWACIMDGKIELRIASHEDDAIAGKGRYLDVRKVQPWSDELWSACEEWISQREVLQKAYSSLARGKPPTRQTQPNQLNLWTEEITIHIAADTTAASTPPFGSMVSGWTPITEVPPQP